MAFDGLFTRAITHEIANSLYTGRISKIYQPSKYEILLHIRANGKNQKLILSAHPTYARFTLNKSKFMIHLHFHQCSVCFFVSILEGGFIKKFEQILI